MTTYLTEQNFRDSIRRAYEMKILSKREIIKFDAFFQNDALYTLMAEEFYEPYVPNIQYTNVWYLANIAFGKIINSPLPKNAIHVQKRAIYKVVDESLGSDYKPYLFSTRHDDITHGADLIMEFVLAIALASNTPKKDEIFEGFQSFYGGCKGNWCDVPNDVKTIVESVDSSLFDIDYTIPLEQRMASAKKDETSTLSNEFNYLQDKIKELEKTVKEQREVIEEYKKAPNASENLAIEFISGQGKRTKTKKITAKEIADIAMEFDFANGMTKSEMQDMLSRITGISNSSFQNYLKTNS